jgi:hypothetical protein
MLVSRTAIATTALVIGSAYALLAQPAPDPPIGMLLAAGDISTCKGKKDEAWLQDANKTAGVIREAIKQAEAAKLPYRILALGDLAYDAGTGDQFKCFAERWTFDDVVTSIPKNEAMLPVPGNHEYKTLNAQPYFDHFSNNPLVTQNGALKGYFAVNFPNPDGPWRLIGLNDNFASALQYEHTDKKELKEQTAWLEKDLADAAHQQNCVLAFWHAPTFSSGQHGHVNYKDPKEDAALTKHRPMKTTFGILYRHGASVLLNGHEHNYEQFRKQDENGKAVDDGIRLFVVGTGGAGLTADFYNIKEDNSEGIYGRKHGIQGVLKILLYSNRYEWEFLPITKTVVKTVGKKEVTTTETKKLELPTTSADCNKRK